ncbi:hypothetical protein E1091_02920 [Micromonospora fluostatini]|uniref:Uncharacterized protein n=1 Tax=Micromonospora fluostatini TaxID=1629071 RepID=A0ABY2DKR1_9ACTN|nr:hypothetical protein E1091_02920 [Micromonospora fluostatini]
MFEATAHHPGEDTPRVIATVPDAQGAWARLASYREAEVLERGNPNRPDRIAKELRRISEAPETFTCGDAIVHDPHGPGYIEGPPVGPTVRYAVQRRAGS